MAVAAGRPQSLRSLILGLGAIARRPRRRSATLPRLVPRRVLIVDDSMLAREWLRRSLESTGALQVVGEAKTGEDAIALARELKPDLVTMDLHMPGMGGLKAMERIVLERAVPVVVISERTNPGKSDINSEAMAKGAMELVAKSEVFGGDEAALSAFVQRMAQLANADAPRPRPSPPPSPRLVEGRPPPLMVGIGVSTGGPRALAKVLGALTSALPVPVAVVQHLAADFFESFLKFLSETAQLPVRAPTPGDRLLPGHCYLAPPGFDLTIDSSLRAGLSRPRRDVLHCPSVDALFSSMALALGARSAAVLMTGMGADGAAGLLHLRRVGGFTAVQEPSTCAVAGMPQAALDLGVVDEVAPLDAIAAMIKRVAGPPTGLPVTVQPPKPSPSATLQVPVRQKILVCDDSPILLEATRMVLEGAGYDVATLDNPLMVAMRLRRERVDLVLLDVNMPTVKGPQVVEVLRSHGLADVPVLLFSDLDERELEVRARECGARGFVRKSGAAEGLLRTVRETLSTLRGPSPRQ